MMRRVRSIAALATFGLLAVACSERVVSDAESAVADQALARGSQSIIEIAQGNPELTTLVAAVNAAGLTDRFGERRVVTVFAPTNDAFAKLGLNAENIATELAPERLAEIVLYHVTPGVRVTNWLADAKELSTKHGARLSISKTPEGLVVNQSRVEVPDIYAVNGIVHVIDAVLMPPEN